MPVPTRLNADAISLAPRVFRTSTVVASPADATETTIASLTIDADLSFGLGVLLIGWCTLTVGTNGASVLTRIRRTSTAGTAVAASGATSATAANLVDRSIACVDTGPTLPGQAYVMTLTVGGATAASTVAAVQLVALVI